MVQNKVEWVRIVVNGSRQDERMGQDSGEWVRIMVNEDSGEWFKTRMNGLG